ncbi:uncharacterized protein LOC102716695 [Oryza brachyantha]|uniref:Pectinesterase inhibitor domain-containing protein n=1 Tax=Oryza brachyantha TaxID=4533 RepID=J3M9C5_ORYBR|nr:uncharacterized protein LOC102716695 [Oryza brachyantha]
MARFVIISVVVAVAAFAAVEARVAPTSLNTIADNGRKMAAAAIDECALTCEHVRNKRMCDTLRKLPGVSSPRDLLSAAVKMSAAKAKAAKARFEAAAASSSSKAGNPTASILDTCISGYDSVVAALEEVQQCIDAKDSKATLVSKMSAAATFTDDCDDAFVEFAEAPSFAAVQRNVRRVVSSTLAIAAKLKQ